MRIAVISDVHANQVALAATIDAIWERGVDEIWCLGDTVGYGPRPDACVDLAREHCQLVLAGNHDVVVTRYASRKYFEGATAASAEWAEIMLSAENFAWLRSLSAMEVRYGIACFHASIRDHLWEFVDSLADAKHCLSLQETDIALFGHTHTPAGFRKIDEVVKNIAPSPHDQIRLDRGQLLLNPGTVGRPQAGALARLDHGRFAMWMLIDTEQQRATYYRSDYDLQKASKDYMDTGLTRSLRINLAGDKQLPDRG